MTKTAIVLLLLVPLIVNGQQSKPNRVSEKKIVLATVKAWNDAFTTNDPGTYFGYIHDDLTLFFPSSPYRVDGKADDRVEFEYSLHKNWTKVGYFQELQPNVQLYDDTAIVTYYTRGTYGPEGKEKTIYLKETDVLVKVESEWKVVHIHVSSTP